MRSPVTLRHARRLLTSLVLGALCVLAASPRAGAAVSDYIGKPIAAVRITIEGRDTTDPSVTDVVETSAGQPLSMAQVRESISHLYSLGRFEDVRVDAALEDGRLLVRYDLSPIHPIAAMRFEGVHVPGVDANALRQAVTDRVGVTPPLARVGDMTKLVEGAMADRGYLHATVVARPEISHTPERATLVFAVQPNGRTTVGAVTVTGSPTVSADQLR